MDIMDFKVIYCSKIEGTQPEFPFPNLGDPPDTSTYLKKKPFISFKPF